MVVIFLFMGLITGGIISFLITKYYYERAGKDLKKEVGKLRQLNIHVLRSMEEAGLIKWNRDSQGKIIGLDIKFTSASMAVEETSEGKTLH